MMTHSIWVTRTALRNLRDQNRSEANNILQTKERG